MSNSTDSSSLSPVDTLPDPDTVGRETDVVIYDGDCKFCTKQVSRLKKMDTKGVLSFLSLHDGRVSERYPNLTHDQLMEEMYVVDSQGNQHAGAAAFRYLTTRLPKLWLLAPVMHIPFSLPLWKWGYRQVAKRRYRWGKFSDDNACSDGACEIHFR